MDGFLKRVGHPNPKIGVAALNPHAGEAGLFGDEEQNKIIPAVLASQTAGANVHGPIPADALMRLAAAGKYDGVVAMYHDQGHIALKLLGYDQAVNITLGLPIVRTSPSHGTAYDICLARACRCHRDAQRTRDGVSFNFSFVMFTPRKRYER